MTLSFFLSSLELLSFCCERRVDGEGGPVEVDVDPTAVPPVPYPGLLGLLRVRVPLPGNVQVIVKSNCHFKWSL